MRKSVVALSVLLLACSMTAWAWVSPAQSLAQVDRSQFRIPNFPWPDDPIPPTPVPSPAPPTLPAACQAANVAQLQACLGDDKIVEIVAPIEFAASQKIVIQGRRNLTIRGASPSVVLSESAARFQQGTMGEFFEVVDTRNLVFKNLRFTSTPSSDARCAYPGDRYNTPSCNHFIMVSSSTDTLVENVEFDAQKTMLFGVVGSTGTTFRNSRFLNASTFGIWSDSFPHTGPTVSTLIEGNYFRDVGANAIIMAGSIDLLVQNNTFENNHRLQQYLVNGNPTGGGQVVVERNSHGFASRNVVYTNNVFKNSRLNSSVTGLEIAPFYENDLDGLYVTGNSFQGHTGDAITIGDTSGLNRIKNLVITGNTLTNNFRTYRSQMITKAIENMTLGNNTATSSAGNIKTSLSAPACPIAGLGCTVRLSWTVSATQPVKVFQRAPGIHPSLAYRTQIIQTASNGYRNVSIPPGGAVFEIYSAADYTRPDGYGWEAPSASLTVR